LIVAVRSAPRPTVEKLVTANPELLRARDPANSTLLHHAAGFGTLETLTWLLNAGADVKATNRLGSTPLHWAIHDEAKVRLLLARGAGVNTKQRAGRTPLYQAASLGNGHAILRLLLEQDPNLRMPMDGRPGGGGRGDVRASPSDACQVNTDSARDRADGGLRQPGRPAAA
jgi:ankyrin repeat protein